MRIACPNCGKLLVEPAGNPKSYILLVGEFPGFEEVRVGYPFVGKAGDVMRYELGKVGLQLEACRITNLWGHAKDEKECNPAWHLDRLVKEFKGRTHVLLMGSDVVGALTGEKVSEMAGLQVKIKEFKDIRFWISPNPAIAFHMPIGDLRLSFQRFAEDIKKSGKIGSERKSNERTRVKTTHAKTK